MTNAFDQLHAIPSGILIIPTAALENSVSNKGSVVELIVKDHRVRGVPRGMDYAQRTIRITFQTEYISIPKMIIAMDRYVTLAIAGQVQMRIGEIGFSGLMDIPGFIHILRVQNFSKSTVPRI